MVDFKKSSFADFSSANPKILIVDLSRKFGGASTRAISIAQILYPWKVIIAGIDKSPVLQIADERGLDVRVVGRFRTDPSIPFRIASIVRREGIKVIDTQNIQSKFWVNLTRMLVKFSFVSTLNSSYRFEYGNTWKSLFYHLLDHLTNWNVNRYIAVSSAIKKDLVDNGIHQDSIDLVKNSVDVNFYSGKLHFNPAKVRQTYGISQKGKLCILVGRLVWAKGFDSFVTAFSKVVNKKEDIYAVIVGEGSLREDLEKQIEEMGLGDHIFLLGYKSQLEISELLLSSDIYVISSRSEGIPFTLLEAAASGLPIVATNCGGITEVVKDGESALIVPAEDANALCNSILKLCDDEILARRLGDAARLKIIKDYSLSAQSEVIKRSYLISMGETLEE